jgi:hypothetical protein
MTCKHRKADGSCAKKILFNSENNVSWDVTCNMDLDPLNECGAYEN